MNYRGDHAQSSLFLPLPNLNLLSPFREFISVFISAMCDEGVLDFYL